MDVIAPNNCVINYEIYAVYPADLYRISEQPSERGRDIQRVYSVMTSDLIRGLRSEALTRASG
jgi:hypothetical protein